MFVGDQIQILLCAEPVDMRKGAESLAGLVRDVLREEPLSGTLFVFYGKNKERVRVLYWHHNGFAMWTKRMQDGKFYFPEGKGGLALTRSALRMILEGVDLKRLSLKSS
jgi:transposase